MKTSDVAAALAGEGAINQMAMIQFPEGTQLVGDVTILDSGAVGPHDTVIEAGDRRWNAQELMEELGEFCDAEGSVVLFDGTSHPVAYYSLASVERRHNDQTVVLVAGEVLSVG